MPRIFHYVSLLYNLYGTLSAVKFARGLKFVLLMWLHHYRDGSGGIPIVVDNSAQLSVKMV